MTKPFKAPEPDFDRLAQQTHTAFAAGERRVDAFYKHTYPVILRECSKLAFDGMELDYQQTQVCLLLVYSWMSPSRLDKKVTWAQYRSACAPLDRMKHHGSCTLADVNSAVELVNDSVVGASKFLHFVAPQQFSIWDQHVARYCGFDHRYQYDSPDLYAAYVDWLRSRPISEQAVTLTAGLLGVTPEGQQLRCKEFLLFQAGLKLKTAR
ncbi:hypothetical protein GOFOIKOB_1440 [Methylobacterium tardum]|uniref:Uncharacterized protein n=1 Tax=Methylobacterium tardum TaxID=374432 RepID=A0AA37TP63_9HYPH|nr:hypothetical protein [Methylobacterium tardum]URD34579.1 hypothetical protein M6G65_18440 [Methylobacterium tardum]GJE48411.1 hypothetical protein GOFOIKOB_1440 [Methylobacterium tardum]GLS73022.1 hypothetical protein GCM10007890_50370 [Methylobacterium tardum]